MDLSKLSTGEKVVAATGIALVIDLLFLPWHSFDVLITTLTRTGVESPNGFWGVLALLVAAAMVAAVVVTRLTTAKLPDLPVPLNDALFFAGVAVAGLLVLKLLTKTDDLGFGCWLGILLAGGLAYGGFLVRKEAGTASAGPTAPTV